MIDFFVEFRSLSSSLLKFTFDRIDSVQGISNTICEISRILRLTFTRSTRLNKLHSFVTVHDAFQLYYSWLFSIYELILFVWYNNNSCMLKIALCPFCLNIFVKESRIERYILDTFTFNEQTLVINSWNPSVSNGCSMRSIQNVSWGKLWSRTVYE